LFIQDQRGRGIGLSAGTRHYRAFVGPPHNYDLVGAMQFNLLTALGLREEHYLLDIGCGSLRVGRLFIPYLLPGRYHGIEPERWLLQEGIAGEVGHDLLRVKRPVFSNDACFRLSQFQQPFDFILAQSIFSHAAAAQVRCCLAEARRVMKPTTIFAATFLRGTTDYEGADWQYPDCVTYTLERMQSLAADAGLVCELLDWPHPNNRQSWVCLVRPEKRGQVQAFGRHWDSEKVVELAHSRQRLARLEGHIYVRLGQRLHGYWRRFRKLLGKRSA